MALALSNRYQADQWVANYYRVRRATSLLFDIFYRLEVRGILPEKGPRVLIPTHQTTIDDIAQMRAIEGEPLAFVYAYYRMPHILPGNPLGRVLRSMGGIEVRHGFIEVKKLFSRLEQGNLVVAYPQGILQPGGVKSFKSGIAELVSMYEKCHPEECVKLIPVGIEYTPPTRLLPKRIPSPVFHIPMLGTKVTITFGEPKNLDGRTPKQLTEVVMREAAELSNLPYNA